MKQSFFLKIALELGIPLGNANLWFFPIIDIFYFFNKKNVDLKYKNVLFQVLLVQVEQESHFWQTASLDDFQKKSSLQM